MERGDLVLDEPPERFAEDGMILIEQRALDHRVSSWDGYLAKPSRI